MRRALCLGAALLLLPLPPPHASAQASDDSVSEPGGRSEESGERPKRKPRGVARPGVGAGAAVSGPRAKRAAPARAAAARPRKGRPPRRRNTPYDRLIEGMHAPAPVDLGAIARSAPVRDLVFRLQGRSAPYVVKPLTERGGFDTAALEVAKHAFGSWEAGPTPHPRLLDLIYAAVLHFDVPYVYLISGVRRDRGGSRHSHGLAADLVFPGVTDEDLAAYFRAQGFCGVGTYPRSGFVHVDTRDKSYFWVDHSAPGRRGRVVGVRAEEARRADQAAVERGTGGFVNPPRLQKALNAKVKRRRRQRAAQQARSAATAEPAKQGAAGPEK